MESTEPSDYAMDGIAVRYVSIVVNVGELCG